MKTLKKEYKKINGRGGLIFLRVILSYLTTRI